MIHCKKCLLLIIQQKSFNFSGLSVTSYIICIYIYLFYEEMKWILLLVPDVGYNMA